ncbi:MAG: ABC transporter permease [Deltaproteobacteria bacterium]|jgi:ABC-type uncharacterized transport system permease subunit|nr:ABC transporter permease [Deltaproteobacteria bacterium]
MDLLIAFLESTLRVSVPLLFAAYGGLISERSGLANVAIEGQLLVSAFSAAATAAVTGNPWLGLIAGFLSGAMSGFAFGFLAVMSRADQIVVGIAFNMLVAGFIPTVCRAWFGVTGGTPQLEMANRLNSDTGFFLGALVLAGFLFFALRATRWGLRLKAAGDEPMALVVQGVSPARIRILAGTLGGAIIGIGGVDLSMVQGSGYIRDMAGGRGFIALAALILGGWRPVPTAVACFVFAAADATQMLLQGQKLFDVSVPNSLVQIIPYLATVFVLAMRVSGRGMMAPRAINQPV